MLRSRRWAYRYARRAPAYPCWAGRWQRLKLQGSFCPAPPVPVFLSQGQTSKLLVWGRDAKRKAWLRLHLPPTLESPAVICPASLPNAAHIPHTLFHSCHPRPNGLANIRQAASAWPFKTTSPPHVPSGWAGDADARVTSMAAGGVWARGAKLGWGWGVGTGEKAVHLHLKGPLPG